MKKTFTLSFAVTMLLGISLQAHAALFNRGADSLGNRLIYDSDLNITWYDYTRPIDNWQNSMAWASALNVNFGGSVFSDWRLPTSVLVPNVWSYDGSTSMGYNITSSELGHLYYSELGNKGYYDINGNAQSGWGWSNTGGFQHLQQITYWSGTEYIVPSDPVPYPAAYYFGPGYGWISEYYGLQAISYEHDTGYAIAVRSGDVSAPIPEPASLALLGLGLAGLGIARRRKQKAA